MNRLLIESGLSLAGWHLSYLSCAFRSLHLRFLFETFRLTFFTKVTTFTLSIRLFTSSSTTGQLTQDDCYEVDLNRIKGKQSLSQLHFLLRPPSREFSIKNTRNAFSQYLRSRLVQTSVVISILLLLGSCERKDNGLVDSIGTPPLLTQVSLSPSQVNSDTINVGANRQPDDLLTITTTIVARVQSNSSIPTSVNYSVSSSDSLQIVSQGELLDNGQGPDQSKGDGLFTAKASFQIRRVQVGTYVVEVKAESPDGYFSNAFIAPLAVYRGNHPPVLLDLVAPDSVKLGNQSQVLLLSVRASDPDGLSDVAKVVFNSYKPDGSASGGNPFVMYDDGLASRGDEKAGDGIFSLLISLPASTQVGTYRFEFQAFDRSNDSSNVIIHRLTVKQ